jgi:hypothetical protein
MLEWLTWPADWLLSVGGVIASWFVSKDKDAANFLGMQMMFATLVLAAVVTLIVYWRNLAAFVWSRWKSTRSNAPNAS